MSTQRYLLPQTVNVNALRVQVRDGVENPELNVTYQGRGVAFDQESAKAFIPMLEHFIKTGELPE